MSNESAAQKPKKKPRKSFNIEMPQLSAGEDRALSRIVGGLLRPKIEPSPPLPQIDNSQQEQELLTGSETTNETTGETTNETSDRTSTRTSNRTSGRPSIRPSTRISIEPSIETSNKTSTETSKRKFISLDATHTGAEQRVYSIMYRETITKGLAQRRFAVAELMALTGINSNTTVIRALKGLCEKYSIRVVSREAAKRFGILYEVVGPKEILDERERAGLQIEPRRKMIVGGRRGQWGETAHETTHETTGETTDETTSRFAGSVASCFERPSERSAENKHPVVQNVNNPLINTIHEISDASVTTSSSHGRAGDDDDKLAKVKSLFEQLSGGGKWKDARDLQEWEKIAHVPLWHVIMGLCLSITRCPEHRFSSLAYAVPEILNHHTLMSAFPEEQMLHLAYKEMWATLNCLASGQWRDEEAVGKGS